MREVTKARVDIHLPVAVEARRMEADAALEVPVHPDPRRPRTPPVTVQVLERVAVSGALHESARLIRDGIVRRVRERAEGIVADVDAGRIDVVFGAGRAVLEVVAAAVLRHPGAFDEGMDRRIAMILPKA